MKKKCFKCGQTKDLDKFYKHKAMADGYLGKCKECAKKDVLVHRRKNIEKIRKYDRQRAKLPHRRKRITENTKQFRIKYPEKYHAHKLLAVAIKSGKITKPEKCVNCEKKGKVCGHHTNYFYPLDVIWLCHACHVQLHKRNAHI